MSIMRMRKMFSRQRKLKVGKKRINIPSIMTIVIGLLVIVFVIGAYYTFGGPSGQGGSQSTQESIAPTTVVAKVGGQSIVKGQVDMMVDQQSAMFGGAPPISMVANLRWGVLNQIIDRLLLLQQAKREGVVVSKADLQKDLSDQVDQDISRRFPTQEKLFNYLQSKNIKREQLVKETHDKLAANVAGMREDLQVQKLQERVQASVQVTDDQVKNWYTEVKVSHILISPEKIMQASSQPAEAGQSAPQPLTKEQADEQAKQKAEKLLAEIKGGADFAKLAKENSDDPGSAEKDGDLGWVGHGRMVPEFEQAAFALQPGEVSSIVKSQFGSHLIKVFETKSTLPQDFDSNKEMYKQQVGEQMKQQVWQQYQARLKQEAKIEIISPALRAQQALQQGQKEEGQTLLVAAAQEDPYDVGSRWQLAQMMIQAQNWTPAVKYLEEITKTAESASDATVWLALAEAYEKNGQKEEAQGAYTSASDRAGAYDYQNMMIHEQLKKKFQELNKDDLVAQEDQWIAEFEEAQKERAAEGGLGGLGGIPGGTFQIP